MAQTLQILAVICLFAGCRGQLALTLDGDLIRSYKYTPFECYFDPYPCGNLFRLDDALNAVRTWLDTPPPPPMTRSRGSFGFEKVGYMLCNTTRISHTWISFPWDGSRRMYLRVLDNFNFVKCPEGMCNKHVNVGGNRYGCVRVWEHRTFNVLWAADPEYVNRETKCSMGWCLVRVRLHYPESCACAQVYMHRKG